MRVAPWILAALLGTSALGGCEDDNNYKAGKPFKTTGGPMDGAADVAAMDGGGGGGMGGGGGGAGGTTDGGSQD